MTLFQMRRYHGQVIFSRQIQIVQNLEEGILSKILVNVGDIVQPGQLIPKIKSTIAEAQQAIEEEKLNYYNSAREKLNEAYIRLELPIIPGMVVSVDILTGRKTILSYLLKPLLRAQQTALRER